MPGTSQTAPRRPKDPSPEQNGSVLGWASTVSIRKEVYVSKNRSQKDKRYDLWGWLLFVVSALFFIASSIRAGDMVGLLGGVFFLLACAAFLASYVGVRKG